MIRAFVFLLAFGFTLTAEAQIKLPVEIESQTGIPVQIVSATASGHANELSDATLTVKNLAKSRVMAVGVKWTIVSGNNSSEAYTIVDYSASTGPRGSNRIQPGDTAEIDSSLQSRLYKGRVDRVSVGLDYVELADGARYGPDESDQRSKLEERRSGRWAERIRLREILKRRGIDALIAELQRD